MVLDVRKRRDVRRCHRARVWLDGVDVTRRCKKADARRGSVVLMAVNAAGAFYLDATGRLATCAQLGRVRIVLSR